MPRTKKTNNHDGSPTSNITFNNSKARYVQKCNASRKMSIKKFKESDSYGINFTYSRRLEGCPLSVVRYDKRHYRSSAHYIQSFLIPAFQKMVENSNDHQTIVQGTPNENYNYTVSQFTTFDDRMINEEEKKFLNQRNKYINKGVLINADVIDMNTKKTSKNGKKKKIVDLERLPNYSHKSSMDQKIIINNKPYSCHQLKKMNMQKMKLQPKTKTIVVTNDDIDFDQFNNNREFIDHYKNLISQLEQKQIK